MVNLKTGAVYECKVMHHRLTPTEHRFNYRVFYLWLDLDALDRLDDRLLFFSRNRFNIFAFYDADHLDTGAGNLKANILQWLREQKADISKIASIRLLTFPRVFGYIFNPVCFYYCFDARGTPLHAIAQVTNTFREQKLYLLSERESEGRFRLVTPKHFYVSPFSDLDLLFDFKLCIPEEKLDIHIDDRNDGKPVLLSALTGERKPLTDARLLWFVVKYPFLTLRVIFLIHWHALRLWLKRIPFYRKAANAHLQQDVFRPHHSISPSKPPL
ncbi:MAG: hypothetical protein RL693_34 [Verrucomicrobiota bacterium]|jgi:DUF1365 family protein